MKNENEKLNPWRHFYLYAKGHYVEKDLEEDLKPIHCDACGIFKEHSRIGDIASILQHQAWIHMARKGEHLFDDFMKKIDPDEGKWWTGKSDNRSHYVRVVEACLHILRFLDVDEIEGSLGYADPKILPITEGSMSWIRKDRKEKTQKYLKDKNAKIKTKMD